MKVITREQLATDNLIVRHTAGSHSYGTAIETSDLDIRGIFCAPPIYHTTPFVSITESVISGEDDTKYYEMNKYMTLFVAQNPNIIESLFIDDSDILFKTEAYDILRSYAPQLLSSAVALTYSRYAIAQLKRMKRHHHWMQNPLASLPPIHTDYIKLLYNLTQYKMSDFTIYEHRYYNKLLPLGNDTYAVFPTKKKNTLFNNKFALNVQTSEGDWTTIQPTILDLIKSAVTGKTLTRQLQPSYIIKYDKAQYNIDKNNHTNYWNWKNNQNSPRSLTTNAHGYDTKNAMHLVRLLRMAEEILTTGKVNVRRSDAAELLDIRAGKWSYDDIMLWATDKDHLIRGKLYNTTYLPKEVDLKLATKALTEAQSAHWDLNFSNGMDNQII